MGFFGKKDGSLDPHAGSNAPDDDIREAPVVRDPEKQLPIHDDDVQTALPPMPAPSIDIDPAVEKRLLRKLDWRVPTLLGFLCKPETLML
ncbi:uncharacterized protein LDX57_005521 [Aspergillus melleus]|uniref:uncharacterized protein n=1 Tax=Aspergillus melleus TaxID=138277 RepID=UPI001E8D4996|nr:uncharacterized protein LDX57_005521 [Aspergillus melleus]KAH8427816.1 hypothetical protein LDX57_005521 [Aspergillus melleus]